MTRLQAIAFAFIAAFAGIGYELVTSGRMIAFWLFGFAAIVVWNAGVIVFVKAGRVRKRAKEFAEKLDTLNPDQLDSLGEWFQSQIKKRNDE